MLDEHRAAAGLEVCSPRQATREEIALNHAPDYIDAIAGTAGRARVGLDPDTSTSSGSWLAAKLAVGAVLDGCDLLMNGRARNAMALVRPPGHHAEHGRAMGFCLFNNVAVGARYLIERHGLERVMIYDWDIHHGNGTQDAFYDSPQVLYISSHQYPYYPGSGALQETGSGSGRGYTVNIPLSGGQDDADYLLLIDRLIAPLARHYRPQLMIISAGYDIYQRDPLGTMQVSPAGFGRMAARLKSLAEELCGGRLLLALEGGYHIEGLARCVQHTLDALTGRNPEYSTGPGSATAGHSSVSRVIEDVCRTHAPYWPSLK
jgi:acetoin utilization deacetylase AcuC-like enzyme